MTQGEAEGELVSLAEGPDPLVGQVVGGKYRVRRLLGAGGMGAVYEATHQVIGKRVAVKVLHREFTTSPEIVQRFVREARAATAIGHPHIVDVMDMGSMEGGGFFQVLEFLDGRSLGDELERNGPLPYARAVRILSQVADALSAAHEKGIIHRDLKPDNVFLVTRGPDTDFVKLLDFGVAKVADATGGARTHTGMAIGTPAYMSPEQAQGRTDIDHRTDLFALGVMTFELLAGVRPFTGDSYALIILQVCAGDAPPLDRYRADVPPGLQAVLDRMLAKRKEDRFPDCASVKAALAEFAQLDAPPRLVAGADSTSQPIPISRIRRLAEGSAPTVTPEGVDVRSGERPAATPTPAPAPPVPAAPAVGPRRSVVPVALGAVFVTALVAGGVALFASRQETPVTPALAPSAPARVRVVLRAEPAGATLLLDDAPVANPYEAEVEPSTAAHILEARLDGYAPARRALTFERAIDVSLALSPVAAGPATAPEPVAAPAPEPEPAPASGGRPHARPPAATPTSPPPVAERPAAPVAERPSAPAAPPEDEPEPAPARALKTVVF